MDKLRDFLQGWWGKLLLAVCLAPMVFLGLDGYFHQGQLSQNQVAKVGDLPIELAALQTQTQANRAQLLQTHDASAINDSALLRQTLEGMIDHALLETQAQALGMQVSDAVISQLLQHEPAFLDANGQFSNELFATFLQSNGLTKDKLFASQRREINVRTLTNGILTNVIYTAPQVNRLIDLQETSRPLWVKRVHWQPYADKVSISDDEINTYYTQHKSELISPAKVDLAYIELSLDSIQVPDPSANELKQAYQTYLRGQNLGQKQLAHILLTGDDANARLAKVQAALKAGEDFATVAQRYSDDPSGKNGGDIGAYNAAVFGADAARVDAALASLQVGEISLPVQTAFGVHIFKVLGRDKAPSFDSLKDELSQQVQAQKQQALFAEKVATINAQVADGFSIQDIANQQQLTVKTLPDYADSPAQMLLAYPAIKQAAFDQTLIDGHAVSGNIDLQGATLWLQPSNYRPKAPMTIAAAKDVIRQKLLAQKASDLALADANQQIHALGERIDPAALMGFTKLGATTQQSPLLNHAERASLFAKPAPKGGVVGWAVRTDVGVSLMVGGEIASQAQARINPEEKAAIAAIMQNVVGQDYLQDYLHYLRTVHKVSINDEALKSIIAH